MAIVFPMDPSTYIVASTWWRVSTEGKSNLYVLLGDGTVWSRNRTDGWTEETTLALPEWFKDPEVRDWEIWKFITADGTLYENISGTWYVRGRVPWQAGINAKAIRDALRRGAG